MTTDQDPELVRLRAERLAKLQATKTTDEGPRMRPWCEKHWKPYKDDETLNGTLASKYLFDVLLADEPFQLMCGRDVQAGKQADTTRIPTEAAKVGPICCYVGEDGRALVHRAVREARERAFTRAADAVIYQRNTHGTVTRPDVDRLHGPAGGDG